MLEVAIESCLGAVGLLDQGRRVALQRGESNSASGCERRAVAVAKAAADRYNIGLISLKKRSSAEVEQRAQIVSALGTKHRRTTASLNEVHCVRSGQKVTESDRGIH